MWCGFFFLFVRYLLTILSFEGWHVLCDSILTSVWMDVAWPLGQAPGPSDGWMDGWIYLLSPSFCIIDETSKAARADGLIPLTTVCQSQPTSATSVIRTFLSALEMISVVFRLISINASAPIMLLCICSIFLPVYDCVLLVFPPAAVKK